MGTAEVGGSGGVTGTMTESAVNGIATFDLSGDVAGAVTLEGSTSSPTLTSNTLTSDVYAIVFDQKGLMAGVGIQGSKITRIQK